MTVEETVPVPDIANADVAAIYAAWPQPMRKNISTLRTLIFDVAEYTIGAGKIVETLKWGVPAYLTVQPKSGTTIRLSGTPETGTYGLYVHCQSNLIERCRALYADSFVFENQRALIFEPDNKVPEAELRHFIAMALTYHLKSGSNKL